MTLSNISALCKIKCKADVVSGHLSKTQGTMFGEIFLIPKCSVIICRTVSLFIFSSSAISLTPTLRSERINFRTLSTFASAGSYAPATIALRVIGARKPPLHDKAVFFGGAFIINPKMRNPIAKL
jgi:hypothetical protein